MKIVQNAAFLPCITAFPQRIKTQNNVPEHILHTPARSLSYFIAFADIFRVRGLFCVEFGNVYADFGEVLGDD